MAKCFDLRMVQSGEEVSQSDQIGSHVNSGCPATQNAKGGRRQGSGIKLGRFPCLACLIQCVDRGEDNHQGRFDSGGLKIIVAPLRLCPLVFQISSPFAPNLLLKAIDAAAPNASMSSIPTGSGPELEKFPDAPPSIEVTAPEEAPHAGLRSLDHCMCSPSPWSICE